MTFTDNVVIAGGAIAVTGLNAGANTVNLAARGATAITDGDNSTTLDITGTTVTLTAATGIGATGANASIEVNATTISATNATSGGIFLNDLGTGGVAVTANAQTAGALEILGATEAVTLTNLDTANGAILVSLTGQNIVASDVVAGGSNNIVLTTLSSGTITLGTVTAAGDTIDVNSITTVVDVSGDITATTLDIAAAGTVGLVGTPLTTTVTNLIATTSAGGIFVTESDTLVVAGAGVQVTSGSGDIALIVTLGNLTLTDDITANSSGNVTLTLSGTDAVLATGNGDDDIVSGSGAITITADALTLVTGNITSSGGALILQPNAVAETIGLGNSSNGVFNHKDTDAGLLSHG